MGSKDEKDKKPVVDYAKIQEQLEFAKKLMETRGKGAESFLLTLHVVRNGRIYHHFDYEAWKNDDFGKAMIAMGVEARRAELSTITGGSKVSG